MYLMAAQEIEQGKTQMSGNLVFEDYTVDAMTLEMILQYLGIMLNCFKARKKPELETMALTIRSGNVKEYANITIDRGILDYRIVKEEKLNAAAKVKFREANRIFSVHLWIRMKIHWKKF